MTCHTELKSSGCWLGLAIPLGMSAGQACKGNVPFCLSPPDCHPTPGWKLCVNGHGELSATECTCHELDSAT